MTRIYRFAQDRGGQKLHLVEDFGYGRVSEQALCGRRPLRRGSWGMTINAPLGHGCKRCLRAWNRMAQQ